MKKVIQFIVDVADFINIKVAVLVSILFIPLVGLSVYEVIVRRLFGKPTIWSLEMTRFSFVPIAVLALGYTFIIGGHATIDVFTEKFSEKLKAIIHILGIVVLLLPTSIVMFMNSYLTASMSWASLERTPSAFNAPIYPIKALIPIGFALLTIAAISELLKSIYFLATNEKMQSKARNKHLEIENR
ncbi:MAG: TRAP transporter small permease subunit [Gudongella sp.]|jgi:TRAP-type mannitol/chloroaromatic compound transport system permease small subunit|nr:TRAP transporter small permease subunit [Gudongella sp.]